MQFAGAAAEMKKTNVLVIMDGFGYSEAEEGNAIAAARTPNLDKIFAENPHSLLGASGASVGLPEGQMGNSEVGHLNMGSGRIIYQDLLLVSRSIEDGSFSNNIALNSAMESAVESDRALHLIGLLSDGGVHSHISHLFALIDLARDKGIRELYIHCILDGRDVPPKCAAEYIEQLEAHLKKAGIGRIATVSGRYYTMDRDKRWERIEKAYDALTSCMGMSAESAAEALQAAYERGESDEFVLPTVISPKEHIRIKDGDSVIMFNFRPDRAREITRSLCDADFDGFKRQVFPGDIHFVCMTEYEAGMPNVAVAYPPEHYRNTLGEYAASLGLTQLRLAETEKYAHVTFFFNGGAEEPNINEDRILVPSPKVATYDLQPEMSAFRVRDEAVKAVESGKYDIIIINFANPDMVGHTGVFGAAVKAVEAVDECVGSIYNAVVKNGGSMIITSDHGNADTMTDADGEPVTKHSTNPVPVAIVDDIGAELRDDGILADIAPTLLDMMGIEKPAEMTGKSLRKTRING